MVMAETVRRILEVVGVDPHRFRLDWASAAEAPRFVQLITEFTENIKKLGSLGEAEGISLEVLKFRLEAARELTSKMRFRAAFGNLARELKKAGDYSPEGIASRVEEKLLPLIKKELLEAEINALLAKGPVSIEALTEKTGASEEEIVNILKTLSKKGQVVQEGNVWQPKREGDS